MANTFHRVGADVYFAGYKVAILRGDVPATILGEVEEALDAYDPDAVLLADHEAALAERDAELDALTIASKRGKS